VISKTKLECVLFHSRAFSNSARKSFGESLFGHQNIYVSCFNGAVRLIDRLVNE